MPNDPLQQLQAAARLCGRHAVPGSDVRRVIVLDVGGHKLVDVAVPPGGEVAAAEDKPQLRAGWQVTDEFAIYDGRPVRVSASRLGLLKRLADSSIPISAEELAKGWGRNQVRTSGDNIRYHIKELNREIREVFPDLDFDPVGGTGEGYELRFR